MTRAPKRDIPGIDWRITSAALHERGVVDCFASAPDGGAGVDASRALVVEIGFGRGEFLLHLAREAPGVAHLGVEYSWKRVLKMARRLARTELRNVRLLEERAEVLAHELLPCESVTTFWVNYPDPWPKKRHAERRLLRPPTLQALAERLRPGGELQIATDDAAYAGEIAAGLAAEPLLENLLPSAFVREMPGRLPTAYELEWRAEGRSLHFFTQRRRDVSRESVAHLRPPPPHGFPRPPIPGRISVR